MDIQLGGVEKTLLMPLYGRAKLTKEGNPLFEDKQAADIIDRLGFDFSPIDEHTSYVAQINYLLRAKVVDDSISEFLKRYPKAAIINMGCGLDTTFYRVDNSLINWYDIDLPSVIELRKKLIPDMERSKCISASIFDMDWAKSVKPARHNLFICMGVLEYFDKDLVISFLLKLAETFPGGELLFNTTSNNAVNSCLVGYNMKKMGMEVTPTIMGNIIKSLKRLNNKMTVTEYYSLSSRIELKDFFDKKTIKQLKNFYMWMQTKFIHLKFAYE